MIASHTLLFFGLALTGAAQSAPAPAADATIVKDLEAKATYNCIGLKWDVDGDGNRNATCKLRFRRKGLAEWRDALDLFRVVFRPGDMEMNRRKRENVNALAGSIFHLAPGTTYEVALSLADPDGGSVEKTIVIATHALPQDTKDGRLVKVPVGQFQKACADAQPGDILLLEKGDHGSGPAIARSGTAERPIMVRGPAQGEAIIHGPISVGGAWWWFDRLTLDCTNWPAAGAAVNPEDLYKTGAQGKNGFNGSANSLEIAVTRCKFINHHYGCDVWGHRWFVTDCSFDGERLWRDDLLTGHKVRSQLSGEGIDFHHHQGGTCVAAFNTITGTSDCISYGDNNIDVYNNLVFWTSDDLLEPDYGFHNYRLWGNRGCSSLAGLSFQPFNGGPWYVFRNQLSGAALNILKLKEGYGPVIFVNNTLVQDKTYKRFSTLLNGIFANNVWVTLPNAAIGTNSGGNKFSLTRMRFMDNNAYGVGEKPVWVLEKSYALKDLHAIGFDKNSRTIRGDDVLADLPADPRKGTLEHILPRSGSPLVDGGAALPNIIPAYTGKAPDIGAYELELGPHWVGPRTYAPSGLAYGAAEGWSVVGAPGPKGFQIRNPGIKSARVALALERSNPSASIVVTFEPSTAEAAWARYRNLIESAGEALTPLVRYSDSLAAKVVRTNGRAELIGAQWTSQGVWVIQGECDVNDLAAVRPGFFLFVSSLLETITVPDPSQMTPLK